MHVGVIEAVHKDGEGRVFYGNSGTGETTWEHPLEDCSPASVPWVRLANVDRRSSVSSLAFAVPGACHLESGCFFMFLLG